MRQNSKNKPVNKYIENNWRSWREQVKDTRSPTLTLMALVDWHLTWCDTLAVWFISGRTSTHGQSSSASDKNRVKKEREEEKEEEAERNKHASSPQSARLAADISFPPLPAASPRSACCRRLCAQTATDSYCTCHARRGKACAHR